MIYLTDMIEEYSKLDLHYKLPVALGVGLKFEKYFADLTQLQHVLMTGVTGSGKSVFGNDIIIFLASLFPPSKVNFLIFDFKQVEFLEYKGLPHLISPVINNIKSAYIEIEKLIVEKNRRLTSHTSAEEYPHIVVLIDTFSDWICADKTRFENLFTELITDATSARIHVIMWDSRMSPNVYTQEIMALFPTKIAFAVPNHNDSVAFLGVEGAEALVGKGDMLFLEKNTHPIRIQAPLVTEEEIKTIV